jgi:hypothetical protein
MPFIKVSRSRGSDLTNALIASIKTVDAKRSKSCGLVELLKQDGEVGQLDTILMMQVAQYRSSSSSMPSLLESKIAFNQEFATARSGGARE